MQEAADDVMNAILTISTKAPGAHAPPHATHNALISSNKKAVILSKKSGLPVLVAVPDSGATVHVTCDQRILINGSHFLW